MRFLHKGLDPVFLCMITASLWSRLKAIKQTPRFPQVAVLVYCSTSAPVAPEGTNTCGVWAVSRKEPVSLFWWLTENREASPKADEVTGLRLCFCCGTITSYLPGGLLLSSPCNCDLSVKTRPLSLWQIEAQRSDSLGCTSVVPSCKACGLLMWSQCWPLLEIYLDFFY